MVSFFSCFCKSPHGSKQVKKNGVVVNMMHFIIILINLMIKCIKPLSFFNAVTSGKAYFPYYNLVQMIIGPECNPEQIIIETDLQYICPLILFLSGNPVGSVDDNGGKPVF